jgi:hypothetical protein
MGVRLRSHLGIVFAITFVILSVFLSKLGHDYVAERLRKAKAEAAKEGIGFETEFPERLAYQTYIGYALSAPAFVAARSLPLGVIGSTVTLWGVPVYPGDFIYLLCGALFWYLVGTQLQGWSTVPRSQWRYALQVIFMIFGTFVCYFAIKDNSTGFNPEWFETAAFVWGMALTLGSAYILSGSAVSRWTLGIKLFCIFHGLFVAWAALRFYEPPESYFWGKWFTTGIVVWGAVVALGSLYLLTRDTRKQLIG